ncbi:MAG: DUF2809 domain-containing protein [Lewinella sp.]|nr:DUF2809 domain-containing protein [Lewinella sp.]
MKLARNRLHYFLFIILTIALGLLSRTGIVPKFIYAYLGDALYALMFFFIFAWLFPRLSTIRVFLLCVGFCYLIECSQLYQADWINVIRRTRLGGLVLGFGFLWGDLVSYFAGGLLGACLEWLAHYFKKQRITENPVE